MEVVAMPSALEPTYGDLPEPEPSFDSDIDSARSDVSETLSGGGIRRPGSGRRKKTVPWRSPFDSGTLTDYTAHLSGGGRSGELNNYSMSYGHHGPSRLGPSGGGASGGGALPSRHAAAAEAAARRRGSPALSGAAAARRRSKQDLSGPCCHCGAGSSPQWRKGPKGKPVLCNACGIRFLRTRTLGKTMPKKRRAAVSGGPILEGASSVDTSGAPTKRARSGAEGICTEEEDTEVVCSDDAQLCASGDVADSSVVDRSASVCDAPSGAAGTESHQVEVPHAFGQLSRLSVASVSHTQQQGVQASGAAAGEARPGPGPCEEEAEQLTDRGTLLAALAAAAAVSRSNTALASSGAQQQQQQAHGVTVAATQQAAAQPQAAYGLLCAAPGGLGGQHMLLAAPGAARLALALALQQQQHTQHQQALQQLANATSVSGSPQTTGVMLGSSVTASPLSCGTQLQQQCSSTRDVESVGRPAQSLSGVQQLLVLQAALQQPKLLLLQQQQAAAMLQQHGRSPMGLATAAAAGALPATTGSAEATGEAAPEHT